MRTDDLAPLMQFNGRFGDGTRPGNGGDIGFHMGTVQAWDSSTGENTIAVFGATVSDIPVLSTADSIMLNPGDQCGLIRFKSTYFILGRISAPGGGAAMGIRSDVVNSFDSLDTGNGDTTGTYQDLVTVGPELVDVYIGSSRRCLIVMDSVVFANNSGGYFSVEVSGASSIDPDQVTAGGLRVNNNADNGTGVDGSASATRVLTADDGLQSGFNTFTMKYRFDVVNNGTGAGFQERTMTVFPF